MNNLTCECSDVACAKIATIALSPKARTWHNSDCAERIRRKMEAIHQQIADNAAEARTERLAIQRESSE